MQVSSAVVSENIKVPCGQFICLDYSNNEAIFKFHFFLVSIRQLFKNVCGITFFIPNTVDFFLSCTLVYQVTDEMPTLFDLARNVGTTGNQEKQAVVNPGQGSKGR